MSKNFNGFSWLVKNKSSWDLAAVGINFWGKKWLSLTRIEAFFGSIWNCQGWKFLVRTKEALENSTEQKRIICGSGRVWCVERQGIEAMLEANSTPIWLDSGLRILLKSAILGTLFKSLPPPQSLLNQYFRNSFECFVRGGGTSNNNKIIVKVQFLPYCTIFAYL